MSEMLPVYSLKRQTCQTHGWLKLALGIMSFNIQDHTDIVLDLLKLLKVIVWNINNRRSICNMIHKADASSVIDISYYMKLTYFENIHCNSFIETHLYVGIFPFRVWPVLCEEMANRAEVHACWNDATPSNTDSTVFQRCWQSFRWFGQI